MLSDIRLTLAEVITALYRSTGSVLLTAKCADFVWNFQTATEAADPAARAAAPVAV